MSEQESAPTPPWVRLQKTAAELLHLQPACRGQVHPLATVNGVLELGEGSVIKPGTVIEGHVRIGKNCSIGPNAYLRGQVSIGDNCVIGNAVEIKSSVLGNSVFVSHLTYIGDSWLEDDINVGGGCIFSNFRHDAAEIRMLHQGKLMPTGLNKLGCCVGAHSRIGCKCVVLPGRVLPPYTQTYPGTVYTGSSKA
ncbi:MAG: UDP-N-acetylglucosamine diphosphorylase [Akkermansia sp.]|nr:UDP-N-acetylglucosamine diphosphorylase [Akkermansia sp.]